MNEKVKIITFHIFNSKSRIFYCLKFKNFCFISVNVILHNNIIHLNSFDV